MRFSSYEYALGLSSQYLYCGLPLRLDTYSKCQFGCTFCFAKSRGGNFAPGSIKAIDPTWLERKLHRALSTNSVALLDEFIRRKVPFHLGGMSDPFPKLEELVGITQKTLKVLSSAEYPTIISTKGTLFCRDDYLEILAHGRFVLQFSVTTSDENLHKKINLGAPSLQALFESVRIAAKAGVPTVCRIQPALPDRPFDVVALIERAANSGVRFVAVEHLKIGMENAPKECADLSQALGYDIVQRFRKAKATRFGREWILPISDRLEPMLEFRRHAHSLGMFFGAADTDLLYLSDGDCCCNGSDLLLPGLNHYRFTINEAIRRGIASGTISYSSIHTEWRPQGSIKRYVNSKSRNGATVEDHMRSAWNRISHGPNLTTFFGVKDSGDLDSEGLKIYKMDEKAVEVLKKAGSKARPSLRSRGNQNGAGFNC